MTRRPRKLRPARKAPRRKVRKAVGPDPLDAMIDTYAKMLGLKVDETWKPAIRGHLNVVFRLGALVQEFKLPDDAEPVPVFKP